MIIEEVFFICTYKNCYFTISLQKIQSSFYFVQCAEYLSFSQADRGVKIPKHDKTGPMTLMFCKLIFRDPSTHGSSRRLSTTCNVYHGVDQFSS